MHGEEIGEADAELTISNVGIGSTFYFMPINVYFSSSFTLAKGAVEFDGEELDTDNGLGIYLAIGKEW